MNSAIEKVRINLCHLMDLNRALLEGSLFRIENANELLSITKDRDLGFQVGINLLDGAFWQAGDVMSSVASNFCCGLIANYTSITPPSIQMGVSTLLNRFQNTSYQFNADLEKLHSNPTLYWDNIYAGTVYNPWGEFEVSTKLSDLADITIPGPNDDGFQTIVNKLIYGTDQVIWWSLLGDGNFVICKDLASQMFSTKDYPNDAAIEQLNNEHYKEHPAEYINWLPYNNHGDTYYQQWYSKLGTGWDGPISDGAANYLFNDLSEGYINPNATKNTWTKGLFNRKVVFTDWKNINHTTTGRPD